MHGSGTVAHLLFWILRADRDRPLGRSHLPTGRVISPALRQWCRQSGDDWLSRISAPTLASPSGKGESEPSTTRRPARKQLPLPLSDIDIAIQLEPKEKDRKILPQLNYRRVAQLERKGHRFAGILDWEL
jgi:hypothetical protein